MTDNRPEVRAIAHMTLGTGELKKRQMRKIVWATEYSVVGFMLISNVHALSDDLCITINKHISSFYIEKLTHSLKLHICIPNCMQKYHLLKSTL